MLRAGGAWGAPVDVDRGLAKDLASDDFLHAFPKVLLANMLKKAGAAKPLEDREINGIPCRAVEVAAGSEDVARLIGKDQLGGDTPIDQSKSTCTYDAWIGREDLLLHAISTTLHLPVRQEAGMEVAISIESRRTVVLSDFGKPDFNPPEEVRKKLGIRDAPPAAKGADAGKSNDARDGAGTGGSDDETKARALLNVAEQFARNKMPDKAADKLRDLITKYPNTEAAATAKARLAEIEVGGEKK